ncbi:MAG: cysteine--tRNA ligase, partial [Mariprofundales bacterium]|nr:cysteine--tRNA ligase [Mariprofundales bacterium]
MSHHLHIYNSLTRRKERFTPLLPGRVGLYLCGVTVYDYSHIGHARVMVAFDTIYRWLQHLGYTVNFVRNFTDIDDKIIARAKQEGESISSLTSRMITAFHQDVDALGCLRPTTEPRATAHMASMIEMIAELLQRGNAYIARSGDILYAVRSFPDYGELSGKKIDELESGSRVAIDPDKRDPLDFVLWKMSRPDEPSWSSPWGEGRPGWHIECSAMSCSHLGSSFDIHGGGMDLRFPHHENEIAQARA